MDEYIRSRNIWMHNKAKEYRLSLRRKPTHPEKEIRKFLKAHEIKIKFQHIIFIKDSDLIVRFYIADFYIPKYNLIIEIDGLYHFDKDQQEKDKMRTSALKRAGYNIIRFNNNQACTGEAQQSILNIIKNYEKTL